MKLVKEYSGNKIGLWIWNVNFIIANATSAWLAKLSACLTVNH